MLASEPLPKTSRILQQNNKKQQKLFPARNKVTGNSRRRAAAITAWQHRQNQSQPPEELAKPGRCSQQNMHEHHHTSPGLKRKPFLDIGKLTILLSPWHLENFLRRIQNEKRQKG